MGERVTPFGPPFVWSLSLIKKDWWIRVTFMNFRNSKTLQDFDGDFSKTTTDWQIDFVPRSFFFLAALRTFCLRVLFRVNFYPMFGPGWRTTVSPCLLNLSVKGFPFWLILFCSDQNPGVFLYIYIYIEGRYIGNIISQYKAPYKPISINGMSLVGFDQCSPDEIPHVPSELCGP